MLPIKDASHPIAGQPATPTTRAADAVRPAGAQGPASQGAPSQGAGPQSSGSSGGAPATQSGSPPVATQRPSHGHQGHGHAHGQSHSQPHGAGQPRRDAGRESKSAGSPNIQDVFLNYARREKLTVVIQLLDGRAVEGRIKNFDRFALIVDHAGVDHLVFKHAIATIRSPRSIGSYYASHEAS
jgi:host factor-I protein